MAKIYVMKTTDIKEKDIWEGIQFLDSNRQSKILSLHLFAEQRNSFGLGILSLWVLQKYGYDKYAIQYTKDHKPYVNASFYVSFSHSRDYVGVAISSKPIGVDLQEQCGYTKALEQRYFTLEEQSESQKEHTAFYRFWCRKEAYIKVFGYIDLQKIPSFIPGYKYYDFLVKDTFGCVLMQDQECLMNIASYEKIITELA